MKTKNALLKADYWIQTLLGGLLLLCCFSIAGLMIGLFLAIPFGGWQVLSALIIGISYNDKKRLWYLLGVAFYFMVMLCGRFIEMNIANILFSFYAVGAVVLGIYYYSITLKDYRNIDFIASKEDDTLYDNILDV